jgi:hypothetical protein
MSCNGCEINNNPSCFYNTLSTYNANGTYANSYGLMNPMRDTINGECGNSYVVPAWPWRPTYDTLVKGNSCNGYANIQSAYGVGAENCCPKYTTKRCDCVPKCRPCQNDVINCACDPETSAPQYMPKLNACGGNSAGAVVIQGQNGGVAGAVIY